MKLYGNNPVIERIKTNPSSIRRILIVEGHADAAYIAKKCQQHKISFSRVQYNQIKKLAQNANTQGLIADVDEFAYADYGELLETAIKKKHSLIFLDNLTDPQNLGGIIRTAGALGNFDVILPTTESAGVTESVLRVACGGENYVQVARVTNLANAIGKAREAGFWIMGTSVKDAKPLQEVKIQFPVGFVVGSEEKGVRDIIRKRLDEEIMIPMKYERMSLNAAHATSIIAWEIARKRT